MTISELAIIESGAVIEKNVEIEPFATVKKNVIIREGSCIKSHAYIDGNTTIGAGSTIWPFTSIGTQTQCLKYNGETTYIEIGENCQIREHVVINASWGENSRVIVGDNCLIMGACHIAHNCQIGNNVVLSNCALLGGHVKIDDFATIGGMVAIHQFCHIGRYVMVGAKSGIVHDIPPFVIGAGNPFFIKTVNRVGLKRRGISIPVRAALRKAVNWLFHNPDPNYGVSAALADIEEENGDIPEVEEFVSFCRNSRRNVKRMQINPDILNKSIAES